MGKLTGFLFGFAGFIIMLIIAGQIARRNQTIADWTGLRYVPKTPAT